MEGTQEGARGRGCGCWEVQQMQEGPRVGGGTGSIWELPWDFHGCLRTTHGNLGLQAQSRLLPSALGRRGTSSAQQRMWRRPRSGSSACPEATFSWELWPWQRLRTRDLWARDLPAHSGFSLGSAVHGLGTAVFSPWVDMHGKCTLVDTWLSSTHLGCLPSAARAQEDLPWGSDGAEDILPALRATCAVASRVCSSHNSLCKGDLDAMLSWAGAMLTASTSTASFLFP